LTRQAQLLAGLGPQQAQILLGGAADIVGARSTAAEIAGLQNIAQGQQQANLISQGAQLAGQFLPSSFGSGGGFDFTETTAGGNLPVGI
jgi:hypothetical protein